MDNVIDFNAAKHRKDQDDTHLVVKALDTLALALVEHNHEWTQQEHILYVSAVEYFRHE